MHISSIHVVQWLSVARILGYSIINGIYTLDKTLVHTLMNLLNIFVFDLSLKLTKRLFFTYHLINSISYYLQSEILVNQPSPRKFDCWFLIKSLIESFLVMIESQLIEVELTPDIHNQVHFLKQVQVPRSDYLGPLESLSVPCEHHAGHGIVGVKCPRVSSYFHSCSHFIKL